MNFPHRLEIRRAGVAAPSAVDDWNQPVRAADALLLTTPGWIQPRSAREQALLTDAGAVATDHRAFLPIVAVTEADQVRRLDTGEMFEVRAVHDAAGLGHHLELDLNRVTP